MGSQAGEDRSIAPGRPLQAVCSSWNPATAPMPVRRGTCYLRFQSTASDGRECKVSGADQPTTFQDRPQRPSGDVALASSMPASLAIGSATWSSDSAPHLIAHGSVGGQ